MSVKIKINWDNENVVSESVRIYRADSAFTSAALPPILTEIVGDIYEYGDLDVVENQTYFYMLSTRLAEQEVFTECFKVVVAKPAVALEYIVGSIIKNGPTSGSTASSVSAFEPSSSNASNIVIAVVSTQTAMQTPDGWTLLSSRLNTYIFWRRGGNPGTLRSFSLSSSSQIGVYMFVLQPNGAYTTVECVSALSSKSTTAEDPTAPSPILTEPVSKRGYEIMLGKPQYAQQSGSTGTVSTGYTLIATHMYPTKVGDPYHTDLILGGRKRENGEQVGGGVITQINAYQPSILFMQTIQICAY